MDFTINEVLQYIEENDVKFVRLMFCDIFGQVKNVSIMASKLPSAFENGVSFDASSVSGFMKVEESDLFLFPDPTTLAVLPWRPQQGRVVRFFCDIRRIDGSPFEGDGRWILRQAVAECAKLGYTCNVGSEIEFYLFKTDDYGAPTGVPQDSASYLDVAPLDKGENVRRDICLSLEEMGICPTCSHHEMGPGQNEIDFEYSDALQAADDVISFKTAVKAVAARNGLFASFMPKPFPEYSGNGYHINLSLAKNGKDIFITDPGRHNKTAESFIAGILARTPEITAFLNPTTNSYTRFGSFEAPVYVSWSHQNRSQLIRIPAAAGNQARLELRSPDPSCNPYLAIALLIYAGLDGIQKQLELPEPANFNFYDAPFEQLKPYTRLPHDLNAAVELAEESELLAYCLPARTRKVYFESKRKEWQLLQQVENKHEFERSLYFETI